MVTRFIPVLPLTHFNQCFISIPPENVVYKRNIGLNWVTFNAFKYSAANTKSFQNEEIVNHEIVSPD